VASEEVTGRELEQLYDPDRFLDDESLNEESLDEFLS
jgi:hypothetical protein